MKILEVRDGFIKFEVEKKLPLTSFVKVSYFEKSYIAQVLQVKNAGSVFNVYAKLVYMFNGVITAYDKSLPSRDASVEEFSFAEINEAFENKTPITPCEFIDGNRLNLDKSSLDNLIISVDSPCYIKNIVTNISNQNINTVVIDMQGNLGMEALVAAKDFKLPLNTDSLEFIYEDCLSDATSDSKGLIKEIFADLAEYSKTVDFLPFGVLKSIVDDMVEKNHIFKLLVLKNKLAKFDKQQYFAADKNEVDKLNDILKIGNTVIDLSKLEPQFQNRYLAAILNILSKNGSEAKLFVNVSNALSKKNLKALVLNKKLSAVLMTCSKFKYLNEIKTMFKNFIIEPSFANNEVFGLYKNLLKSLSKEELLFVGEASSKLPLVIRPVELIGTTLSENSYTVVNTDNDASDSSDIEDKELTEVIDETQTLTPIERAVKDKSEELIEKLTEEVGENTSIIETVNLFEEEEADTESNASEIKDEAEEEHLEGSFASQSDFHTEVDSTAVIDVPEEIASADEEEILPDDITVSEELDAAILDNEAVEESLTETLESADEIQETPELLIENGSDDETYVPEVIEETTDEVELASQENTVSELDEVEADEIADDIVELDENDISDEDIIVDLTEDDNFEISEELDKEIIEDVDKVYTTIKDESISDEDLDFIDELNSELNEQPENEELSVNGEIEPLDGFVEDENDDELLEPIEEIVELKDENSANGEILETRSSTTPIVPVYNADIPQEDTVQSDLIEQGDTVVHVKYGTGVVEKMIKYGTKTLYSINFDNVGRRLLDPTLTEIKKA